jgi:hypothetical protein
LDNWYIIISIATYIVFYMKKVLECCMRESAFAGLFYEKEPKELNRQITECFTGKMGPGALPIEKRSGTILALLCPHAGYAYSGMCAAWAYKAIAEAELPDAFIIIGTGHTGLGSGISLQDWKTPLGTVRTDKELAESIIKKGEIRENEEVHGQEHSVEVQLPFLQFANKSEKTKVRIVPIVVSEDIDYKKAGEHIRAAILESKKKVCIIASSDFTHYGYNYGYLPFFDNVKERIKALDIGAIDLIAKDDYEGFLGYIARTGATICGAIPIAVMLRAVAFKKAETLQYYTSGELSGDYKNSVSYASMIFR